ncbi:hypothetical protein BOX15_Mlig007183g1, partial [Macrostomum lignano]
TEMTLPSLLLLLAISVAPPALGDPGVGTVWPMPRSLSFGPRQLLYMDSTRFSLNQPACLLVQDAIVRARRSILDSSLWPEPAPRLQRPPKLPSLGDSFRRQSAYGVTSMRMPEPADAAPSPVPLSLVRVEVQRPCNESGGRLMWPSVKMNESYTIAVSGGQVNISAPEPWGAMYGLETLAQLISRYPDGTLRLNETAVSDQPRFAHRGILLDTSRHYLPVRTIMQNLDGMAYNKMNVFHWHIVDDQSFPYQSYTFPELSDKGAYSGRHVYSQQDVASIVEHARRRGIRVVPEFDTPGHTLSWGAGRPGLLTACYNGKGSPDGTYGPVDPTNEANYPFLSALLSELSSVFPDTYLHLGGDEVPFDCWQSNPKVRQFMADRGFGQNYSLLENYYENRIISIATSGANRSVVVWQELLDNAVSLPRGTIVHVWKGGWQDEMAKVTARGYPALLSSCWYLDYIKMSDWKDFYACDPLSFSASAAQKARVIGGEACLWGEFVDASNAVSQLWPRASAVAERLWSNQTDWRPEVAEPRYAGQRCRMLYRGLNPEPSARTHMCYGRS